MSAHSTDAIRKSIQKKRALQNYNGIFCREHNKKIDGADPKAIFLNEQSPLEHILTGIAFLEK